MCAHVWVVSGYSVSPVDVRGQPARVASLLPPCESLGPSFIPTEPSHRPSPSSPLRRGWAVLRKSNSNWWGHELQLQSCSTEAVSAPEVLSKSGILYGRVRDDSGGKPQKANARLWVHFQAVLSHNREGSLETRRLNRFMGKIIWKFVFMDKLCWPSNNTKYCFHSLRCNFCHSYGMFGEISGACIAICFVRFSLKFTVCIDYRKRKLSFYMHQAALIRMEPFNATKILLLHRKLTLLTAFKTVGTVLYYHYSRHWP